MQSAVQIYMVSENTYTESSSEEDWMDTIDPRTRGSEWAFLPGDELSEPDHSRTTVILPKNQSYFMMQRRSTLLKLLKNLGLTAHHTDYGISSYTSIE